MGYNGEDVRSRCDVCAVGSMWAASVRCEYSSLFTYGAHADAHNKSPVSGDGARSYGVVQDNFCMSELEAVWYMGHEESAYGMKGKGGILFTWTVLVPLHKTGQLGGEHRSACAPT